MAVRVLSPSEYLSEYLSAGTPLLDSRSESEFMHARIPSALNIPLLKDDERAIVGTTYKTEGKESAVIKGFELVGPRFHEIIKQAQSLFPGKEVMMYCWRGGMRSGIMAWLLETAGFKVTLLKGGYKAYRNWVAETVSQPRKVIVLGGHTGSGKTELLHELKKLGEQVIDLEHIANHKGSAYGSLGKGPQPSTEQFENSLALELFQTNPALPLWLENESRSIGSCMLPAVVYDLIRNSPMIDMKTGYERRKNRIKVEYACFPVDVLKATTEKIKKRLGPQHLKNAIICLDQGDFDGWLDIVMAYYDKLYEHGTSLRNKALVFELDLTEKKEIELAAAIQQFSESELFRSAFLNENLLS